MNGCDRDDFHQAKNSPEKIRTGILLPGKKAERNTVNANNPVKSDSFPVNGFGNAYFR
jgi:hypothetical protein